MALCLLRYPSVASCRWPDLEKSCFVRGDKGQLQNLARRSASVKGDHKRGNHVIFLGNTGAGHA